MSKAEKILKVLIESFIQILVLGGLLSIPVFMYKGIKSHCEKVYRLEKERMLENAKELEVNFMHEGVAFYVVKIDSHEYIFLRGYRKTGITHKADCKYCQNEDKDGKRN